MPEKNINGKLNMQMALCHFAGISRWVGYKFIVLHEEFM